MLNEQTKFTLTLGRIIVILLAFVGAAFTVGMTYQQVIPDKKIQEKQIQEIEDIKITMSRVTTILENMEKSQQDTRRDISALQSTTHVMNTDLQLLSADIKEQNNKRR